MDNFVIKQGARTRVTCGQVVAGYNRLRYTDDLGSPNAPTQFSTLCELYTAVPGYRQSIGDSRVPSSLFFQNGDPGSWIVDFEGRLVAMLDSGLKDGPEPLHFVSS